MNLYRFYFLTCTLVSLLVGMIAKPIAGQTSQRALLSWRQINSQIEIQVTDGVYLIEPFNRQIVHTTFLPGSIKQPNFSYAVSNQSQNIPVNIVDQANNLIISTSGLVIKITKQPLIIEYQYNDKLLIREGIGYFTDDTLKAIGLQIEPSEILYGGGERVMGMNHRGHKLTLYNKANYGYGTSSELMNYTLPLFLSSKKYAVLFDNAASGFLDLDSKQNNTVTYSAVNGTMNYYVVAGDSWLNLIEQYTWLTGRQPLPPIWAFGNFSSRFGYHSQREVMQTIQKFKTDSIPVDAVIVDIYWFGQGIFGAMGNLDWYLDSFPEPQKMISDLRQMGVKTVLVTEPFILTTSNRWNEAVNQKAICNGLDGKPFTYNFYFGNTGLIDIFKPEARLWFWDIYKKFTNQGVAGWWGDLGEPELHPYGLQHVNGSANDVHNAYGHSWAQLIYEGYQKDFPQIRPFILMRSGYAGSQRFGIIPWTGDVSRGWGGLVSQPELALTMAMQGIAYTHSDLGGFAGGDSLDNELYSRWLQYGVFQPIFRPHAQEQIPSEPVFQKPLTKQLAKDAIRLRYKLLPYNYSIAFENNQTGKPMMMPLFFAEPDNPKLATYDSTYLWGDNFLVQPVKKRGQKQSNVYFPAGSNWIDFYTNKTFKGGSETIYELATDHIPVFVREGAIIPMNPPIENTDQYDANNVEIHYWIKDAGKSVFNLYCDDGKTPEAYEKQASEIIKITMDKFEKNLTIDLEKVTGQNYKTSLKKTVVVIHGLNNKPLNVMSDHKELVIDYRWVASDNTYHLNMSNLSKNERISVKL